MALRVRDLVDPDLILTQLLKRVEGLTLQICCERVEFYPANCCYRSA